MGVVENMNRIEAERGYPESTMILFYVVISDDFTEGVITGDGEYVQGWKPKRGGS